MDYTFASRAWRISRWTTIETEATGHRADSRGPRRAFSAIHVVRRPANALILGLVLDMGWAGIKNGALLKISPTGNSTRS